MDSVRLACVKHAASVRPEPGSNSPSKNKEPSKLTHSLKQTRRPQRKKPPHPNKQYNQPPKTTGSQPHWRFVLSSVFKEQHPQAPQRHTPKTTGGGAKHTQQTTPTTEPHRLPGAKEQATCSKPDSQFDRFGCRFQSDAPCREDHYTVYSRYPQPSISSLTLRLCGSDCRSRQVRACLEMNCQRPGKRRSPARGVLAPKGWR